MLFEPKKDFEMHIRRYCAQAERCTQDVTRKLIEWNVPDDQIKQKLEILRQEKFLDDRRFVENYVSDKWKLSGWGKTKIRFELQQKELDETLIDQYLDALDPAMYRSRFFELMDKKRKELPEPDSLKLASKMASFAASRGFEEEWVHLWLDERGLALDE